MLTNPMNKQRLLSALMAAVLTVCLGAPVFAQVTIDQVTDAGVKRADAGAAEQQRVEQIATRPTSFWHSTTRCPRSWTG
jgi:hypothetical protein